ncbi:class I SAM-dependent methyltransferase [Amycolatopsis sp. NPDC051903]|uniref:class I SAM-dependent methyltransferase n=1 Tax=Amycolatopsis sp. NPDC051903 TaxID=3363936 RepID=UPI0037BC0E8A
MAELVLTDERRGELLALLDDEQRLQVEHPKLAEYLAAAPSLRGTGDDQMDAAFDLRFIHYMADGTSTSANPYWEIVKPLVFEHEGRRVVNGGRPSGSVRLAYAETILQSVYAYAIPSSETVKWAAGFCAGRPLLELGAGRGYWAAQLSRSGMSVDAYDIDPPDAADNASFTRSPGQRSTWHPVGDLHAFEATDRDWSNTVLFLCWPPGWGNKMASEALARFERAGGRRLLFVGEPKGGKTGDDAFFEALSAGWDLAAEDAQFVSWWNVRDVAQGWVRR